MFQNTATSAHYDVINQKLPKQINRGKFEIHD